jgi:hypothetical protein
MQKQRLEILYYAYEFPTCYGLLIIGKHSDKETELKYSKQSGLRNYLVSLNNSTEWTELILNLVLETNYYCYCYY